MLRRVLAGAILLALAAVTLALGRQVTRPSPIARGDSLPAIEFRGPHGAQRLRVGASDRTVVMVFLTSCGHCHEQLDLMNANAASIAHSTVFILTPEADLFERHVPQQWPALAAAPNIHWGTLDVRAIAQHFGVRATPTFLIFDRHGRFLEKRTGEADIQALAGD